MRGDVQGFAEKPETRQAAFAAGQYLTDEVFLYRVVGFVADESRATVQLEDCYWLDVVSVPMAHVSARRLRPVVPLTSGDQLQASDSRVSIDNVSLVV